jgi:hypothetical protein
MIIACTTKGCLQTTEAKLNRDTGDVKRVVTQYKISRHLLKRH